MECTAMHCVTVALPDVPFIGVVLGLFAVYIFARTIARAIPVVGL